MAKAPMGSSVCVAEHALGVQEASAVAALGNDTFLVVDDEHGAFRCVLGADPAELAATRGFADLEGLCVNGDRTAAYLLTERDGSVWRYALRGGDLDHGERIGELPRIGSGKNQGWEGLAFAAGGLFGKGDELVATHQTKPASIGFFDAATLAERAVLALPKQAKKALGDLNDLTLDPATNHLLVLSGKEGLIAELALESGELTLVRLYEIDADKKDVPEGITFGPDGRLWVVTDGRGILREMRLEP
jgi:uncharacterized protein YjiK